MSTYAFQPGLLASSQTWFLDGSVLKGPSGDQLDLRQVTRGNFDVAPNGKVVALELKLFCGDAPTRIHCTARVDSGDRRAFLQLANAVVAVLEAECPQVRFTSTGMDLLAWGFAILGGLLALFGLYFGISTKLEDGGNFGLGLGFGMVLLGAFLVWSGSPWEASAPKSPADVRAWIGRLREL